MKITFEQQQELQRLKRNTPDFDVVYAAVEALQAGGTETDTLWEYYYHICLLKAWEFFEDPEDGHNAAFDLMEHWLKVVLTYTEERAKLSPFFDKVALNFFLDRKKHLDLGPHIVYGGTPYDDIGTDPDEDDFVPAKKEGPVEIGPDYPFAVLQDGPLEKMLTEERVLTIRDSLFPVDKEVFDLLVEGYPSEEIEEITGKDMTSVKQSMYRIRKATTEE